jgi:hypothetical protein
LLVWLTVLFFVVALVYVLAERATRPPPLPSDSRLDLPRTATAWASAPGIQVNLAGFFS